MTVIVFTASIYPLRIGPVAGLDTAAFFATAPIYLISTRIISGLRLVLAGKPQNFKLPRHTGS